jgi:hypothetical protein
VSQGSTQLEVLLRTYRRKFLLLVPAASSADRRRLKMICVRPGRGRGKREKGRREEEKQRGDEGTKGGMRERERG